MNRYRSSAIMRCGRNALILAAVVLALAVPRAGEAASPTAEQCGPAIGGQVNGGLPRVTAAVQAKALRVAVLGTGSTSAAAGVARAWPEAFKAALEARIKLPRVEFKTATRKSETAEQQLAALGPLLAIKPDLLVWQTGTVDAVRHTDVIEFSAMLIDGIDRARTAGADIVLVGPQFSPRASALVNFGRHITIMAQVARAYDVPFLDRYALMQSWVDEGRVVLDGARDTWAKTANFVHECVGLSLAGLVIEAAGLDDAAR